MGERRRSWPVGPRTRTRRRLAGLVATLPRPTGGDSAALCAAVGSALDRPVRLVRLPLPPDAPCGLVLTTAQAHYIAYDARTTPLHQRHIVAHELGHLLAHHGARAVLAADVAQLLMPTLDPAVVQAVLTRTPGYDAQAEREAEYLADLLWRHANGAGQPPPPPSRGAAADLVERIRESLEGH